MTAMRLRFSIRDLLWLTLVVALAVGWWVDRWHLSESFDKYKRDAVDPMLHPFDIRPHRDSGFSPDGP